MKKEKEKKELDIEGVKEAVSISVGINGIDIQTVGMSIEKTNKLLNKVVKKHGLFMKFQRNKKIPLGVN